VTRSQFDEQLSTTEYWSTMHVVWYFVCCGQLLDCVPKARFRICGNTLCNLKPKCFVLENQCRFTRILDLIRAIATGYRYIYTQKSVPEKLFCVLIAAADVSVYIGLWCAVKIYTLQNKFLAMPLDLIGLPDSHWNCSQDRMAYLRGIRPTCDNLSRYESDTE